MPRKVVRKERGVFEKVPGSDIWWIRFKDAGVEHREKVGRRGDAIKLYKIRNPRERFDGFRKIKVVYISRSAEDPSFPLSRRSNAPRYAASM